MGIRYEKDTILNWINEMGKFLRLLTDKYEAFEEPVEPALVEEGYKQFFSVDRLWFLSVADAGLTDYIDRHLEAEQIRPLALLLLRDGLLCRNRIEALELFRRSKLLLNYASEKLGFFSFEDYANLALLDRELNAE